MKSGKEKRESERIENEHVLDGESKRRERQSSGRRRRLREGEKLESNDESAEVLSLGSGVGTPPPPPPGLGEDHDTGGKADPKCDQQLGIGSIGLYNLYCL